MWRKSGMKLGGKTRKSKGAGPGTPAAATTAVTKYQRLESLGLWRETPEAQRREVVLRMGEATLVFSDPRSGNVVSHWSLPATRRLNPGQRPALYSPGDDASESLEVSDDDMITALRTVQRAVAKARPHPWRLRGWLVGGIVGAVLLAGGFVLPGLMISQAAAMLPATKRAEIGQMALDDVVRLTGAPCDNGLGLPALGELSTRIFGPENTPILYVLPEGLTRPAHLPGGVIVLPRALIELDGPDVLAGAALVERATAESRDPVVPILTEAGVIATFKLLITGEIDASAIHGYGESLFRTQPPELPPERIAQMFRNARVQLKPWAAWSRPAPERAAALASADPFGSAPPAPLLSDDSWIALQSVCAP